ncbi:MAG: putative 4-mercaptohistidine N1-methyltransferase [Verrucomicrobiales bacterium]
MNPYESDRYLAEYLLFHYGDPESILPWSFGPREALGFTRRTAMAGIRHFSSDGISGRALDLGCAVGGSSFVLAEKFEEVVGMDYSHRFIEAAAILANGGGIAYDRIDEGGISVSQVAGPLDLANLGRVIFEQADATDLPTGLGGFDLVHAANLLCRLPEPMKLIHRLPKLVRPGGLLVLATPCSWLEQYTPEANWLGGRVEKGISTRTVDRLRQLFRDDFEEIEYRDEPFLIREHARKFQWSVSAVTVWRRRTDSSAEF